MLSVKPNQRIDEDYRLLTPGNILGHWLKEGECIFSPVEDHKFFKEGLAFLKDDKKHVEDLLLGAVGILKKEQVKEGIAFYATVMIQDVSKYIPNSLSTDGMVEILDSCACKAQAASLVRVGGEYIIKYSQVNVDFDGVKIGLQDLAGQLEKKLDRILLQELRKEVEPFEKSLEKEIAQAVQEAKQRIKTIESVLVSSGLEKRRRADLKHEHEMLEYRIQNRFDGYFSDLRDRIWEIRRQLNPLEELEARVQGLMSFVEIIKNYK